jgi:deoxyribonuclease-1-like protein
MARRSRSRLTSLYGWLTTGALLVGGAGASGWAKPDLPFVGPFVQQVLRKYGLQTENGKLAGATTNPSPSSQSPANSTVPNGGTTGPSPLGPTAAKTAKQTGTKQTGTKQSQRRVAGYAPTDERSTAPGAAGSPGAPGSSPSAVGVNDANSTAADSRVLSTTRSAGVTNSPGAGGLVGASADRGASGQRSPAAPTGTITIATYNIQVFGISKLQQPQLREILAQVVRHFDVVAIQEIRAKDDGLMPEFLRSVNADGSRYDFVIGPRLGRTSSKEQYVFVYNTEKVEVDPSSVATLSDPNDLIHREPMVARFRARTYPPEAGFTFWLVNIHTDPDEVAQEVDVLVDVLQVMARANPGEDDIILLGDLNADETKFGRLGKIPGVTWVVPRGTTTNTRGTQTYDNLLFLEQSTAEFTGRWGVVNMQKAFNLSLDDALKVSDHLPVWAEFQATESMSPHTATRSRLPPR